jgi:hypothetical protein
LFFEAFKAGDEDYGFIASFDVNAIEAFGSESAFLSRAEVLLPCLKHFTFEHD